MGSEGACSGGKKTAAWKTITGVRISGWSCMLSEIVNTFECWHRPDYNGTQSYPKVKRALFYFTGYRQKPSKEWLLSAPADRQTDKASSCVIVYWNERNTHWGMRVVTESDSVRRVNLICIDRIRKCSPTANRRVWYRISLVRQDLRSIHRTIQNSRDRSSAFWCRVAMCPFLWTSTMNSNRPTESYQTTLCLQQVIYEVGYNGKATVNGEQVKGKGKGKIVPINAMNAYGGIQE